MSFGLPQDPPVNRDSAPCLGFPSVMGYSPSSPILSPLTPLRGVLEDVAKCFGQARDELFGSLGGDKVADFLIHGFRWTAEVYSHYR